MKVILKQDVEKLGRRGDVVNVAPGFGRNYLIPRKMALAVTATNVKTIEIERQALKKEKDPASKERLKGIEEELANLKEKSSAPARRARGPCRPRSR